MNEAPIRKIAVVGGGSAGYISALYLKKSCPELDVTVIESTKIPVVGVGEATTQPMLHFLHQHMEFPVQEFFREARPTLKLGIKFVWGKQNADHYNSPFGASDIAGALQYTGDFNNLSLMSMMMEASKVPFIRQGETIVPPRLGTMAYHIDNKHFLRYLRGKLAVLGIHHLDQEITQVKVTAGGDAVDGLVTADGETRQFDLYVDCSGFRSLLLGGALKTEWIDYSASLKTNRAILGMRENPGEISPYTTATTLNHGWLWNTPMQQEDHLGYVFSGDHCTDDEAFAELQQHCKTIVSGRVVKFRTGRHAKSWVGNVVAVGNSFAFIEPLESTGIQMILLHLKRIAARLSKPAVTDEDIRRYNDKVTSRWDHLRWFIAVHFRHNSKLDTPFWRDCRADADVSGLAEYLDYFEQNGPLCYDPAHPLFERIDQDGVFSVFAHDANMAGCGVNQRSFIPSKSARTKDFPVRYALNRSMVSQAIGHRESLRYLEQNPCEFLPEVVAKRA